MEVFHDNANIILGTVFLDNQFNFYQKISRFRFYLTETKSSSQALKTSSSGLLL